MFTLVPLLYLSLAEEEVVAMALLAATARPGTLPRILSDILLQRQLRILGSTLSLRLQLRTSLHWCPEPLNSG